MNIPLPNVVVTNLHRRFTGISASVFSLVPEQQKLIDIAVVDKGNLGLDNVWNVRQVWLAGFQRPKEAKFRVLHTRRGVDMLIGIMMRATPGQRWRLIFTSSANKKPGRILCGLINKMDVIVTTSQASANLLPWHSAIIPHGVDVNYFRPSSDKVQKLIGYAGRIRHSKGADLFVKSMIHLLPLWPEYRAELAGLCKPQHDDFKNKLLSEIAAHKLDGRIRFIGHKNRHELREFYRQCAICVTPSRIEGFGLVPLEALACGTAVVTSDASSFWLELVSQDVGVVAQAGKLDQFIAAIRKLLENPELTSGMGCAAREKIVDKYAIINESKELVKIYRRLINGEMLPRRFT